MSTHTEPGINPERVLWSAKERDRANRPLLVMMHGWSYDETHLFQLVPELPRDLVVVSVRARIAEAGGYAWFPSAGNPIGDPRPDVANAASLSVLSWLDTLHAAPSIGLLGFSQGGAMVLQLMRHSPARFAYGVSLAGFVVNDSQPGDPKLASSRPPVFWGRGEQDRVIPGSALKRTDAWLSAHAKADVRVYPHLGHDVAGAEITDLASFVSDHV
ncbi:MAG TPA: dienelactone hydrolase family protein [Pseudonocardia sp.]|jgi:phospholipase/carboxylesterase|nr:dienelactone hydrolase family protein [Pseudonocardia sp.]